MTRWEYCDVTWQPQTVTVTRCTVGEAPKVKTVEASAWPQLLAKLGADGWELVSAMPSPLPIHEYFFYFKRPLGTADGAP